MKEEVYTLSKSSKPQFLNRFAPKVFEYLASKEKAKKAISSGELKVNGKLVNYDAKVYGGDQISYQRNTTGVSSSQQKKVYQESIEVVFEDNHLGILNKPGGIPVNGNQFKTLENTLAFNIQASHEKDALGQMRPLHRLDSPTCGLVLVAKTERAQVVMGKQFQDKTIRKRYKAVVIGKPKTEKGVIETPIEGKNCTTEYDVVTTVPSLTYGHISLVNLYPVTGRTHQLRIHMAEMGHPIIGDKYYTPENINLLNGKGLFLCADAVWFKHPIHGKQENVEIQIPNKFKKYMEREAARAKG